jgi:hypothetical protein
MKLTSSLTFMFASSCESYDSINTDVDSCLIGLRDDGIWRSKTAQKSSDVSEAANGVLGALVPA